MDKNEIDLNDNNTIPASIDKDAITQSKTLKKSEKNEQNVIKTPQNDDKLRVLETLDVYLPDVDGVINCMHNYCLCLKDKTHLTVMVPKNKKGYVDKLPYKILRCKSMYVPILGDYYGFPNMDKEFKENIKAGEYDIIHSHSPFNMAKFALKLGKEKNIPVVATFHSIFRPIFKSIVGSKAITELILKKFGRLYNKFDEVFCISPLVEEQLRSFGYTGKITHLPFGTDFEKCEKVEENSLLANEKFNLQPRELVFIYVGRVMPLKRIDFTLKALQIVKQQGIKFKFFVVGKGPALEKLKKLAKKLGFSEEEIIFTGFLERELFPLLFSRADLLLFPSLYDNFGLVKVEGASFATPGVYIEGSCAGFEIKHGENGFLSKDTIEDFAKTVVEAVADYDKLKKIGQNAQDTLYISWQECSDILLDNLKRVVREFKEKQLLKQNLAIEQNDKN